MVDRYVVGAGGHGRVVAEAWRAQHPADRFLFLDDQSALQGKAVLGVPVAGPVAKLGDVREGTAEAVIGLGNNFLRLDIGSRWDVPWGRVVHPAAWISPSATLGPGSVVIGGAIVNSQARLGRHVLVNTGAIVEHDSVLEDGCTLGPGVAMGGRVYVGRAAFVSAGATLCPRVRIGEGTIVGAGAVVASDLPPHVLALGVPARVVRDAKGFDWQRLL